MPAVSIQEARSILGSDFFGADEAQTVFGALRAAPTAIPFSHEELTAAARRGEMLVFRSAGLQDDSVLTILHIIDRFPAAFDPAFLEKVGYQLKDEWGIRLEPLAAVEACTDGWALVHKSPLVDSRNRAYDEQELVLQRHSAAGAAYRRRTAIEVVYDTVLYWKMRGTPLLIDAWDWTSSQTIDGGYLNVGGFGDKGMQLLSYSRAVRHGGLGICPTRS